jgi:hypothetical protein
MMEPVAEIRIGELLTQASVTDSLRQLEQKVNELVRVVNELMESNS